VTQRELADEAMPSDEDPIVALRRQQTPRHPSARRAVGEDVVVGGRVVEAGDAHDGHGGEAVFEVEGAVAPVVRALRGRVGGVRRGGAPDGALVVRAARRTREGGLPFALPERGAPALA